MSKIQEQLVAGFIAAIVTGVIAGLVIWKITANQRGFFAHEFAAQQARLQAVGDEITKTAGNLKRLDAALKTTEATLREVKDQVSLVGTRTGIAKLSTLVENANKTLADIKQATVPDQAKDRVETALAPLAEKLDTASKALAALQTKLDDKTDDKARDEALAQANTKLDDALKTLAAIGKTTEALKGSGTDTAKLDDATKSLAAIKGSLDAIKSRADAEAAKLEAASKSIAALDASVRQGFADVASKQSDFMKAVAKPAVPQTAKSQQDLVVFYVSTEGQAAAPKPATAPKSAMAPGLTPTVPPPFTVHFERLGKVDDEGQTAIIVSKLRGIVKGHSGCAIAVAGHADTLGGDRKNYELSKRRANEVADKLKAAFAGDSIPVTETQWGERRLKEWTPDDTANEANRRVDIRVSCKK